MSYELFEKMNLLRTFPNQYYLQAGAEARYYVTDIWVKFGSKPSFIWSNALSLAALEAVNADAYYSPYWSIIETAVNRYVDSICSYHTIILSHEINSADEYDPIKILDQFIMNEEFDPEYLSNFTHLGIGCSCDYEDIVNCAFFFAKGLIAKENSVNLPVYLNFTDYYSCYWDYYYDDVYDYTCYDPYFSTFDSCILCSDIIPDCSSCWFKKNGTLSIECYDCSSGYLMSLTNGVSVCDYCSGGTDPVTGRCLDAISCNSDQYVDPNSNTCIDCSYLNSEC